MESADTDRLESAPCHVLGQYRAWRWRSDPALAFDLAWISLAHAERPAAHRLLPHGEPSVAVLRRRDRHGDIAAVKLIICGPYREARHYQPAPGEELIALRIKPETAAAAFGVAPRDYEAPDAIEAPAALTEACSQTLAAAHSAAAFDIIRILSAELQHCAGQQVRSNAPEAIAAEWMRRTDGRVRFSAIAAKLEVSERHLSRRFSDHVGCAPKTYARHLQITAAALAAERTANPDWAQIALDAGFHDQPHMINAFREEIGSTPQAFHRERRALSGFCNTEGAQ